VEETIRKKELKENSKAKTIKKAKCYESNSEDEYDYSSSESDDEDKIIIKEPIEEKVIEIMKERVEGRFTFDYNNAKDIQTLMNYMKPDLTVTNKRNKEIKEECRKKYCEKSSKSYLIVTVKMMILLMDSQKKKIKEYLDFSI
jgi:hypothetical protein